MDKLLYFSYGSNMSLPRIRQRVSNAQAVSVARLYQHRLRFHKRSLDGSAKCGIEHTRNPDDSVYGVVFHLLANEKPLLDSYEGLGNGYEEKTVAVFLPNDEVLKATTYYATHIDASLRPYHWYKEHVLRGAREHDLPGHYIDTIESVSSVADPDPVNHARELSVYSQSIKKSSC
jgi:hypothetical protein